MIECPFCDGTGKQTMHVTEENGITGEVKRSQMIVTCNICKGSRRVKEGLVRAAEEFWCRCGNPSGELDYFPDGESEVCEKHHWACHDCHRVVQVG